MFLNGFDVSSERSENMDHPFHKFRGRGISVGPEGISVGPGNSVNIGGHQWFGRGKHRKRFRLGDVRAAVLVLLAEQPMHGYQIIQEIAERSGGLWQPSPGSIYPVLQQLEDEGLVLIEQTEGRKVGTVTQVAEARKVLADARRRLYLILAEDEADDDEQDAGHRRPSA